jgi:diacylglycerol O-acyltransferase
MTTAERTLAALPAQLADRLANLAGQPKAVAEVALSALPTASLVLLGGQGIIEELDPAEEGLDEIALTRHGRQVIELCAQARGEEAAPGPPPTLTPELVERLAALSGQPEGVAEVALSALRYGSLLSLAAHGIIELPSASRGEPEEITITARGLEMIDVCAGRVLVEQLQEGDPRIASERDLARRAVLSPLGAALLREESPAIAAQLAAVAQFEGPPPPFAEIRDHVLARLSLERRYRQKVASPPLRGLTRMQWVDDPDFDGRRHVHHRKLSRPGAAAVEKLVSEIVSKHLDPSRPLWEVWIIDGLADGGFVVVAKTHYALVEGLTGVELATMLFDLHEDQASPVKPEPLREPEPLPSSIDMLTTSVSSSIRNVAGAYRQVMQAAGAPQRTVGQLAAGLSRFGRVAVGQLAVAPRSPLNVTVGPRRRVVFTDLQMQDLRLIEERLGGTHVQVALTVLTGALRSWLQADGRSSVNVELKAAVFSADGAAPGVPLHQRMTQTLAPLPINEVDPGARLASLRTNVQEVSYGTDQTNLTPMQELATPTVQGLVLRLLWSSQLYNLIVANLPPVHIPLYMLGRRMTTLHPVVFLTPKHALAVGTMVYDGKMCISVIADSDAIPDLDVIVAGFDVSLRELLALAKAQPSRRARRRVGAT